MEATIEFFDGQRVLYVEPTRCLLRTLDPAAGWTRLQLTVSVPPRADSAVVKLTRTFNTNSLWDDIVLERIRSGPPIEHTRLADSFDGDRMDPTRWTRMPAKGGIHSPTPKDGWLMLDAKGTHPINSLAKFNDLIKHSGPNRYRLRLHVAATPSITNTSSGQAAFSLSNSQSRVTRMLWYLYFTGPGRSQPMLSVFNDQAGVRKFSSSWNAKHLANQGRDLWCTFFFDPTEVTVFIAANGYDESEKSLVCRYQHGLSDLAADGSIYMTLFNGRYKIDDINLLRPRLQQK